MNRNHIRGARALGVVALLLLVAGPGVARAQVDVEVRSFTATVAGSTVTYAFTVCNNGLASQTFTVEAFGDRASSPGCGVAADGAGTLTFGAGACETFTIPLAGAPNGTYTSWITVDGGCALTESNEANNARSATFTVGAADVAVKKLTAASNGTTASFSLELCNDGATAQTFSVAVWLDRAAAPTCAVAGTADAEGALTLAATTCDTFDFSAPGLTNGAYTIAALADSRCVLSETDETDNAKQAAYVISPFGIASRPLNTTCKAPARPPSGATIKLTRVFAGITMNDPVLMTQAPGDKTRWFFVQQRGSILSFANTPAVTTTTTVLDLSSKVGPSIIGGEEGMLGLAFSPQWATDRQAFVSYTHGTTTLKSRVARLRSTDGGSTLAAATEQVVYEVTQPLRNHNGGHVAFGPDGYLYFGLGDGGGAGDPLRHGQNTNTTFGAILRLDVLGATPYRIPASNPFAVSGGAKEIYAYGLRNPWRFSFDSASGDLWLGDVGQDLWEEVNIIKRGANYGWNTMEASVCYGGGSCSTTGLTLPVAEYFHAGVDKSVTGGFVYRGKAIPGLVGTYLYGDYASGKIWGVTKDATTGAYTSKLLLASTYGMSSFVQDADGEVYVLRHQPGEVYRIDAAAAPPVDTFPKLLSKTGCVDPADATKPVAAMIPYALNAPLWSDGSEKKRWFALPDGQRITVSSEGDWGFPVGSVLVKEFSVGAKRIETRLFIRHSDGRWGGYSYEWNAAGTDAALLPAKKVKSVGAIDWTFPSRGDCLSCHTSAAGHTLGPETAQLNRSYTYPLSHTADQLATMEHIGLFTAALPPAASRPRLPTLTSTAPVAQRARAYLHANCSYCHQPAGPGLSMDLRYTTAAAFMDICDVRPRGSDFGVTNARRLAPGSPSRSLIVYRMRALDHARMPPLATSVVDTAALAVIEPWITATTSCTP